jgi:hypothetical protein
MKTLFVCIAIAALAACQKEGNETSKTRAQDNLAPIPASQFGWNKQGAR